MNDVETNPRLRSGAGIGVGLTVSAIAALTSCALNGRSAWALAIPTVVTGATLLLAAPRRLPSHGFLWVALGFLVAGLSGLMPEVGSDLPRWRADLVTQGTIVLSGSISSQPDLTLGACLTLAIAWLAFLSWASRTITLNARRAMVWTVTVGIIVIAGLSIAQQRGILDLGWPFGVDIRGDKEIGPFLNRNHTSSLCAIGCVLAAAAAFDLMRDRSHAWILFAIGGCVPFAAVVLNPSRAGLLLFAVGMTAWVLLATVHRGRFQKISLATTLLLFATAVVTLASSEAASRIRDELAGEVLVRWGRLRIFQEASRLAFDQPLFGVGLGNFEGVFALYDAIPGHYSRFLHPESSWIWWWVESGTLGLAAALIGWIVWIRHTGPWLKASTHQSGRHDQRLRQALAIATCMAIGHGLVDVPIHNFGYAMLVLLLAAGSLRHPGKQVGIAPWLWRAAGVAILGLGFLQIRTAQGELWYPGRLSLVAGTERVESWVQTRRYREALTLTENLIRRFPLHWDLHYRRGDLRLLLNQAPAEALEDFERARYLEPQHLGICQAEAKLWLRYAPEMAIFPWRDLLKRSPDSSSFSMMFQEAQPYPELQTALRQLATTAERKLILLAQARTPEAWKIEFDDLLATDPDLRTLTSTQRSLVFRLWHQRGDRTSLRTQLEEKEEWRRDAWQLLAADYAAASEFEMAWALQLAHGGAMSMPSAAEHVPVDQLERRFAMNPADLSLGVDLFRALRQASRTSEARRILDRLLALPQPPPYLRRELAVMQAEQGEFEAAYETMKMAISAQN